MSKRKSRGLEMRPNYRPPSPVAAKSSSDEWPEMSSASSSSSVSCSSKMTVEGTCCVRSPTAPEESVQYAKAPETKAMALVGCPRCYLYVMLSEVDPKCPKCKSTVFLDFFRDESFKTD